MQFVGWLKTKKKQKTTHTHLDPSVMMVNCEFTALSNYIIVTQTPINFGLNWLEKKKTKKAERYLSFILKYFLHIVRPSVVVANISIFAEICVIK